MNEKCSLINHNNPCKCEQKTAALIQEGYVNPNNLQFNPIIQKSVKEKLQLISNNLDTTMNTMYKELYQQHPFTKSNEKIFAKSILKHREIKAIFEL